MASTVPAKSQPLHNFTLPHLKWNKDGHTGGHLRRRSVKSPSRRPHTSSTSPVRQSPLRESAAVASPRESPLHGENLGKQYPAPGETSKPYADREWVKHSTIGGDPVRHSPRRDLDSEPEALSRSKGALIEYRRNPPKNLTLDGTRSGVYSKNSERATQKSETKSRAKDGDVAGIKRSKILIKIPCKSNKTEEENPQEEPLKINKNDADDEEVQDEGKDNNNIDEEIKTWNLRPRKPIRKPLNVNGGTVKNNGSVMPEKIKVQSPLRNLNNKSGENGGNCGVGGEKKEKRKLSIAVALSKDEIEEDIFALTGSKPARRPKKRAKNIQKQVDFVFPGLWLVSITKDSYKVSENSMKG
ncbi:hypothetical protein CDL12_24940 [Handroanthus impetiginosus]|uniref:DUF1639 domain-containing protein n=1 Tax=Handroanthus impetiginosus TaxID=429701 RepID=A0A2G9GC28_9LAMI|nr:hypothetical protein CDL12_24940 [Handroanthus impetiginosus]